MASIRKILIANRGEIAVRIIRAARELGIVSVQAYSSADADSLAVNMADTAVDIGHPQAARSYLNIEALLRAAQEQQVDAIHPGYGFLAENADFADAVVDAGLIFIGPDAHVIRKMGDKVAARQQAASIGIPTVPGSLNRIDSIEDAREVASATGFPVLIKAAAGGGGRGIRVIEQAEDLASQCAQASTEALATFGDGGLYIEKYIGDSRHIEVQILADGKQAIHLFERDCSLQRRRQKLWEEAPAVTLGPEVKRKLHEAAVHLARAVHYKGAGTVEFLCDDTGRFYFIEMNTRIQVEHPISELVTGVDLIREMIYLAAGNKLRITQNQITCRGHAIEVRINAEDPAKDFMPFPGTITDATIPGGPGVRFDSLIYPGYTIPPFYDSLLGKLIVWDEDRVSAINRLKRALGEFQISGVTTTKSLFQALVNDQNIREGIFDTHWLEPWLEHNAALLHNQEKRKQ